MSRNAYIASESIPICIYTIHLLNMNLWLHNTKKLLPIASHRCSFYGQQGESQHEAWGILLKTCTEAWAFILDYRENGHFLHFQAVFVNIICCRASKRCYSIYLNRFCIRKVRYSGRNWATKVEIEQFFHVCHFEFFEAWAFFLGMPKLRWYTVQ